MVIIALGANLPSPAGEPIVTLRVALETFAGRNIEVERVSPFYRTQAWPNPGDPEFVNAVASVQTELKPAALLAALQRIEMDFGRERTRPNAPRALDLDIIDYDGRNEKGPPELPHPRMQTRDFVLMPLWDIAPDWRHPVSGQTLIGLIAALPKSVKRPEKLAF
jgi:2-amino-4-hydroxy-6-hydroxymethyldihydropteridine diphosphokinase